MRFNNYLINESKKESVTAMQREKAIAVMQRDFKKMGLTFHPKWEDFVKKNKSILDKETEKIRKEVSIIANKKLRDKKFQEEMRDMINKVTDLWGSMK